MLVVDTEAYRSFSCALSASESGVCCRRPGYRSTAEHILTLCKDKEYAVPFLAGQYQKSLIDHALHRLDSQVSMVSALPGALHRRLSSDGVPLWSSAGSMMVCRARNVGQPGCHRKISGVGVEVPMLGSSFLG